MNKQSGSIGGFIFCILVVAFLFVCIFVRFKTSQEVVSGIVYNTTNNSFIGDNTNFSVRASVDTYTTHANASDYCLPPGSPYIALVNKAAKDKTIKVVVTADKYFAVQAPWVCNANVTVTEEKQ